MPKYINRDTKPIVERNTTLSFQKEVTTDFYINTSKYEKLEETSSLPAYSPVLNSQKQTAPGTINIVNWETCSLIRIISTDPVSSIKFNDASTSEIAITTYNEFIFKPKSRVKSIILVSGSIIVEEWKSEDFTI